MKALKFFDTIIRFFEKYVAIFLMLLVFLLLLLQVVTRYFLNNPLSWPEELLRFCFVAMIYFSISYAASENAHIRIEIQFQKLSRFWQTAFLTIADLMWIAFNLVIIEEGIRVVRTLIKFPYISPVLRVSMAYVYIIIPFGFLLMTIRIVQNAFFRILSLKSQNK
jgi:C4-dicarboxylate transporter DctQ subunit